MASQPSFISTPRLASINVATANLHDPVGTIGTLIAGVAAGTKVLEIDAKLNINGASTASTVCIWISSDTGATWRLFDEMAMASATASASVVSTRNSLTYTNLVLPSAAWLLGASTTIAQSTTVVCQAGDLT